MKSRVYSVLKDHPTTRAGQVFSMAMSIVILVNVLFVLLDTLDGRPPWLISLSRGIEVGSVAAFTIEYILRFWTATQQYTNSGPRTPDIGRLFMNGWVGL